MVTGQSGRIVIEVDPHLKRELYSALASDGSTLKAWFIQAAQDYLARRQQPNLPFASPESEPRSGE